MSIQVKNNGGNMHPSVLLHGRGTLILERGSAIRANSIIELGSGVLRMGKNSVLGYFSFIQGSGEVNIGNGSLIGPHCCLIASSHIATKKSTLLASGMKRGKITICDDIWIGANCTINYNVTLNNGCVIGANSFVNKDVPEFQIWAGSPARYIKDVEI